MLFHFKGFKKHFAALKIRELENSWFRFFDVTNSTLKKWSKSVLPRVDPKAEWWLQQPCSATASFWRPEIKAVEASRPASGGWRTAKATKWCQALLFNVSSRHHLLGRYRAISFRATFRALIWRVFSRLDFFSRHICALIWRVFFPVVFFFFLTDYNFAMKNVPSSHLYRLSWADMYSV